MKLLDFIERNKFSVFGTLAIHVLAFVYFNWQVVELAVPNQEEEERVVAILDFSEEPIQEEIPEDPMENTPDQLPQTNMQNVAANNSMEKTTYTNSYSKAELEQQVWDELKAMESAEFNALKGDNPTLKSGNTNPNDSKNTNPNLVKDGASENKDAAYGTDIVANVYYELKGRKVLSEKKPSYVCKSEGIVRVTVKVNQKGQVVSHEIDETKTNTQNECLRNAALTYASQWKFDQNFNDILRKQGWIEFRYAAQ